MGSRCYPDASVSPILFPPSPIFRFSRATADAQWTPPHPSRRGRGGGVGWGLGNQTHAKCNDVDQKSSISLRDFACFSAGRRAGSTRQQNEVKKTRAVGKCFLAIAWLRCPNNETRPRLHAWQALWGCCISQATLAVAQFSGQGKRLPNCTAILCSCPISLPPFPQHPLQAKNTPARAGRMRNRDGPNWAARSTRTGRVNKTQLLEHMVRTYTMCVDKFRRKRLPPPMYVTSAWPCASVDLKIRDARLSKRRVRGRVGGWLGDRGAGGAIDSWIRP